MRKPALYSRSPRSEPAAVADPVVPGPQPVAPVAWRQRLARAAVDPRLMWGMLAVVLSLLLTVLWRQAAQPPRVLTQKDIDAAVLRTLTTQKLPSATARAADKIRPAVVRVVALARNKRGEMVQQGVGSGVVITDQGIILTNLHVVQQAQSVQLVFADGSESGARLAGLQPEHDLAVLQALSVPDDLKPATLRSTHDLKPGDEVVAVGFPFGIGPSTSAGVVSGLDRSFRSPEGEQEIGNLIQFDAAANPGNSGGPLVTLDGEVVGIVTGILNPTSHRTFVGIGFAVPIESAAGAAGLPPF